MQTHQKVLLTLRQPPDFTVKQVVVVTGLVVVTKLLSLQRLTFRTTGLIHLHGCRKTLQVWSGLCQSINHLYYYSPTL